jgi:hypothetical protein
VQGHFIVTQDAVHVAPMRPARPKDEGVCTRCIQDKRSIAERSAMEKLPKTNDAVDMAAASEQLAADVTSNHPWHV